MGLRSYMITRILLMIPTLLLLISIVFLIIRVLPGDPALLHFEKNVEPAQLEALRHALGLDQPIWVQYFTYVVGVFTGDLGKSMQDYSPVAQQIFSAFPATLELAIYSIIIAAGIGIYLGAKSAKAYNKLEDHAIRISGIIAYAVPVFFLGMIFQMIFAVGLGLFPVGGRAPPAMEPLGMNLILPEPSLGFALGFALPSLVGALIPMILILMPYKRIPFELLPFAPEQKRPTLRDLMLIFLAFLVGGALFGLMTFRIPAIVAAPLASFIPLLLWLILFRTRHGKLEFGEFIAAIIVYIVGVLLFTLGAAFVPLLLLSYLIGLLPSFVLLALLKRRQMKVRIRDLAISIAVFVAFWLLLVWVGSYYISIGALQIRTGLYTVDSILEGSLYKLVESFRYLFLPSLTLGIVLSGVFIRLTRTNMIETLRLDFVTAAKARGLKEGTVTYGYALKNAFLPVLTMIGLQFAALLGGAILTETTFSWPGIGRYIVDRIDIRDYTAIQGAVTIFGILVMVVSLFVDLFYAYLDPRIRL